MFTLCFAFQCCAKEYFHTNVGFGAEGHSGHSIGTFVHGFDGEHLFATLTLTSRSFTAVSWRCPVFRAPYRSSNDGYVYTYTYVFLFATIG